ncbi:MAG: hypothetical protein ACOX5Z_04210 [Desulfobulbus sp.]|jgi:hypothetical protein
MQIAAWLDQEATKREDISRIVIPKEMLYDEDPDEILYFKEIRPCTFLCSRTHPFAKVARYGHWYYCTGQDKQAGIHSDEMRWTLVTRDKAAALAEARRRIE